jgi:opacity protein-like surface antigen
MFALFVLTVAAASASAQAQSGREKLGLRLGYVEANGNIDTNFGDGSSITVHFTERIKPPLFIDISIGALYLGKANVDSIQGHTAPVYIGDANMRVLYLNVSPVLEFSVTNSWILYVEGGIGLYSINVILDRVFYGFDTSQEHFGANGTAGLYYAISDNWKLNFNFSAHYMWTSEKGTDMFYFYSEGESDPRFLEFSVGATYSMN